MVLLQSLVLSLLAVHLPLVSASPLLAERKINCANSKVKSLVKTAKAVAGKTISPFCSSYLHYKSTTKTITETYTQQEAEWHFVTSGTDTYLEEATTKVSATTTMSFTEAVYADLKKRAAEATAVPAPTQPPVPAMAPAQVTQAAEPDDDQDDQDIHERAVPQKLKVGYGGSVLGFPASIVSEACSCLVSKPKPATETTYFVVTTLIPVTETVAETYTTSTSSYTWHDYSHVSIVRTKTLSKPTNCGTEAQPTFFIQMRDVSPVNKDKWNNNYISLVESIEWRGVENDCGFLPTPYKNHAVLVTLEPGTGYLREVRGGRYLNTDYFSDFQEVFFNSKKWIDARTFLYIKCVIVKSGSDRELQCSVPNGFWKLAVWQTCPLYVEYYMNPIIFGAEWSAESPDCLEKKLYVVDACT
ncbi:hypothetical protein AK830_g2079 [Neonectria ditissima]|uniref:Uncharacterized protein n=1 Tax=Neonectria ditissima TaxID=78410 RepID=A0A0P7BCD3_9HYPO|nr:hypothetical protein AK830_g2079 [Neonectria ditissima]